MTPKLMEFSGPWDFDRFCSELTATLVNGLAGVLEDAAPGRAVTECAVAAEAACGSRPMACAAGCPHCCVLNVAILLPEGLVIASWLTERLTPSALDVVRASLKAHCSWGRWMEDEERIAKQVVCPLLDAAGHCSIHPVRPLVCRAVASLERGSCLEAFNPIISDEVRLVQADLLRQAAFDAAFTALAQALRYHGYDDRSIELGTGVLAFLERPELRELLLCGGRLPGELWQ